MPFSILNKTRRSAPRIQFEKIKNEVLGKEYELSLVLCGNSLSKRFNASWRGKNKPTNVLSFPLGKKSGEIFLNLSRISAETEKFGMSFQKLATYLFIHGCLHLKGLEHGAKMERAETKFIKKFGF